MRIIGGKFKSRILQSVPGNTARPTTDYTREKIFNIISSFNGNSFLDLFAGSGAVGLEALSRGYERTVFVDASQLAINTIISNIRNLNCEDLCHIYRRRVEVFLKKTEESFNAVFLDPPYKKGLVNKTLSLLAESSVIKNDSIIIVEHSVQENLVFKLPQWEIEQWKDKHIMISLLRYKKNGVADGI